MSVVRWAALVFGIGLSLGSLLAIRGLWRNAASFSERQQSWWLWGPDVWRGWVRAMPAGTVAFASLVLGAVVGWLTKVEDQGGVGALLALVFLLIFITGMGAFILVVLFNRPRFVVPPHLRDQPGVIEERLKKRH